MGSGDKLCVRRHAVVRRQTAHLALSWVTEDVKCGTDLARRWISASVELDAWKEIHGHL